MHKRIYWLFFLVCLAYPAFAAEDGQAVKNDGTSGYQLPEVVVTESKTAQKQETVTQKIDVIYADEFDHRLLRIGISRNYSKTLQGSSLIPSHEMTPIGVPSADWGRNTIYISWTDSLSTRSPQY